MQRQSVPVSAFFRHMPSATMRLVNNRERVLSSLHHRSPDRIPYNVGFTKKALENMRRFYGDANFESRINNCFTQVEAVAPSSWRQVRRDVWADGFGVEWDRSVDKDIGTVVNSVIIPANVETYRFPRCDRRGDYSHVRAVTRDRGDRFVVAVLGFSLFERAWTLAGMENLLMAMACDPPFAHRLLDRILEYNLGAIEQLNACGVDGIQFGDDWGAQHGLIMGPEMWREYIRPRVARMYAAVKKAGIAVFIHSCGKVDELFPDLIELGVDVFNPFQPEVIDVSAAKRVYGDRLCFFGGISTQRILPAATPQETREHVKRLLDVAGRSGGFFASPAHDIPPDARPENIHAMLETLENQ